MAPHSESKSTLVVNCSGNNNRDDNYDIGTDSRNEQRQQHPLLEASAKASSDNKTSERNMGDTKSSSVKACRLVGANSAFTSSSSNCSPATSEFHKSTASKIDEPTTLYDNDRDKLKVTSDINQSAANVDASTITTVPITAIIKSKRRDKLGAVRSLESDAGNNASCFRKQRQQHTPPVATSISGSQQQRQMFSLRQLAINSRNLTKKRASVQVTGEQVETKQKSTRERGSGPFARLFEYSSQNQDSNSNSSSNSSTENSFTSETELASDARVAQTTRASETANGRLECSPDEDDDCESPLDDELGNDDDEEDEENNDDVDREGDESEPEDESKRREGAAGKTAEKRCRGRRLTYRRPSCCNCEMVINKIDYDGLPVTDVDLVTYKDLCQMAQQAHHMRTNHQRHNLDAQSVRAHNFQGTKLRRSSLQEESGAYYQLCTSCEEQIIKQKYTWFPPSLKRLTLVDQFFANFPKDKIPLAVSSASKSSTVPESTSNEIGANKTQASSHPAAASLASSYRDEQISFQLPRQDISLDYCSYPMSDVSRAAYLQFIEKRSSQSLDVGTVVQVNPYSSVIPSTATTTVAQHSGSKSSTPEIQLRRQRKASTVSQSAVALLALSQSQQEQLGQQVGCGAQRCRRCLVRFEDKQLAVVAPNFVIGSALYRPSIIPSVESRRIALTQNKINLMDRSNVTEPPPTNVALFHPNCFTCSTCKEFLVDLVYCLRDNKLYCLRHYGESLRPRCSWCQELIFSDEYLKAMNESFHVDHFLCRHCDCNLAGQRYVLKDEKPFCIQCYEGNFANICEDCRKPIGIDSRDLSYKERHWHDTCFLCHQCQQSLIDKPFGSKTDKVYCADCYDVTFATRCDGCKNPFRAGSKKMEYRGRQWHDSCFCCCICQNTIGSNSFIPKNDEIYCIKCYEDKYATRCTKCKQVIVSGGVTFRNEPWHRDCFSCCNCSKSLAGQRFTTRDVKNETVKDTNKANQPHNAYCIDCYGELFAKKCYACSQAITGLGGTRFVTFEDRSWHNDCFICNDCNTSLVGKGFITDGPETILCGDCARAKLR